MRLSLITLFIVTLLQNQSLIAEKVSVDTLILKDDIHRKDTLLKCYYLHASWIFDGEKIIKDKLVLIRNGYIDQILDANSPVQANSIVISVPECTLMPGFFDGHTHFMGAPMWQSTGVERYGWGKMAEEAFSLFPQHRLNLLKNGITSIIDMGSTLKGYQNLNKANEKGEIMGPRIFYPGPLITAPDGHPAGTIYTGQHELITNGTIQVDNETRARESVDKLYKSKVSFIKIVYDDMWYTTEGAPRISLEVAKAIIDESHKLGLKVFAHIGSEDEAFTMVESGIDGIEHSFGQGSLSDSLFAEMVRKKVTFTPTLAAFVHYAPQAVKPMQKTVKNASDAGVLLVTGTDYPTSWGRNCGDDLFEEFRLFDEAGISRLNVLKSATFNAAQKIGRQGDIGKVAAGYKADLLIIKGRIDEGELNQNRIEKVILEGNIIIDNKEINNTYLSKFRSKHILIIPYFFVDPVTDFNLGVNYSDFDFFNTGMSLNADITYSFRNMIALNLQFAVPTPVPKTRVQTNFHFDNVNRFFYGFGNSTLESDQIEYENIMFKESITTTTSISKNFKLHGLIAGEQVRIDPYNDMELPAVEGNGGELTTQIGLSLGYDTRDHENNPWKGILFLIGADVSPGVLSSCNTFANSYLDLRGYFSPVFRHVLAGRLLYNQAYGEVPFYKLPSYGGSFMGRGFLPQRFTDRIGIYSQFEYRFPVYKIMSCAAWLDIGQVQSEVIDIDFSFHPSFGFGPRLAFGSNENSILSIDAGFSNEGWLIYFRAGQAF